MKYSVGDVLIGRSVWGRENRYRVSKVNRVTVEVFDGYVHRIKPDENGELWTKGGVRLCKA